MSLDNRCVGFKSTVINTSLVRQISAKFTEVPKECLFFEMDQTKEPPSGYTGKRYPELFDIRAMPPQPTVKKPGQLSEGKIKEFFTKGYVVVENFFDHSELDPIKDAINKYVDDLANKLYKAGKISSLYADHGYYDRLYMLEKEYPGSNILCFKQMGSVPKALKDIWTNERLLNVIEQIIGPDISGNPVWNLRTKTPRSEAVTVPWHQDCSYTDLDSYKTLVPTAWIPFLDADETNGCLQFIEGGHLPGLVAKHTCCWGGTWYTMLETDEMEKTLGLSMERQLRTLPIKYGSFVLFNNLIPHRSLDNVSDHVRWSVDLRWHKTSDPAGFYGIKDGIQMRSSTDPNLKPDWDKFDGVNRHEAQAKFAPKQEPDTGDEFETSVVGPWMTKWDIVHVNKHVAAFQSDKPATSMG